MAEYLVQIFSLIGIIFSVIMFILEVRKWKLLDQIIIKKQKTLRISFFILLEVLLLLIFIGPIISKDMDIFLVMIYWLVCLALGVSIALLAIMDLKLVVKNYSHLHKQIFDEIREDTRKDH